MGFNFKKHKYALVLWIACTFFFAFQFIVRGSVGILREDIIQKFGIDTIAFGTLAGYYYLGYSGMQIPVGYMLDKFNFKFVAALSIVITALGTFTFTYADQWQYVLIGRFLIGAGSAAGFLSVAKVTKTFFPPKVHPMMIGFAFTFGLIGAVIGGKPTKMIFDNYGYDTTFNAIAVTALCISFIILSIKDKNIKKYESTSEKKKNFFDSIKLIFNPVILFIGVCGGLMVGALEGFADVWAIPFFTQVYSMKEYDSISVTSIVYTGMCVGGPLLAYISSCIKSDVNTVLITGIFTSCIFGILFINHDFSYYTLACMMFVLGILCCYQVVVFNLACKLVDSSDAGIATAIINCINMSFGYLFHKIISTSMQENWSGALNEKGLPIYSQEVYVQALMVIPALCIVGSIGFIILARSKTYSKIK